MFNQSKLIGVVVGVFSLLAVITLVLYFITPKDDEYRPLTISNLDKHPVSSDDKKSIENQVFAQVLRGASEDEGESVSYTGLVREGSFTNPDDAVRNNRITNGHITFMLDIEQIARSWKVSVLYQNGTIAPSGIVTKCPSEVESKYENDKYCKEPSMQADRPEFVEKDPLVRELPYKSNHYSIHPAYDPDGNLEVIVKIDLSYSNDNDPSKKFFDSYKASSIEWIKSKGVNPDDYKIVWRDISNQTKSVSK